MNTRHRIAGSLLAAGALLTGCETTSISDTGYSSGYEPGYAPVHAPPPSRGVGYRGELTGFEMLGLSPTNKPTEADIAKALDGAKSVRVRRGARVLLVQSGALQPDPAMIDALSPAFQVVPFDGRPSEGANSGPALRLAAAQAGCETIVGYWGVLESATRDYGTQIVTWVPLVGWAIPESTRRTRMRLKVALIDVRSGQWSMISPAPLERDQTMGFTTRETGRAKQVEALKALTYGQAAREILDRHTQ